MDSRLRNDLDQAAPARPKLRIVLVQPDIVWENHSKNLENITTILSGVELRPEDIVVLPEMFPTGFSMNSNSIATDHNGYVVDWMMHTAALSQVYLLGSHPEKENGEIFNAARVIAPDGTMLGTYRKIHLFRDEKDHYSSGDKLLLFSISGVTAAVFICYDLRFPEVFRAATICGAELFFVVASWPAIRREHWDLLLRARAIENQVFVCGCNRTGRDPNESYDGHSCVVGPGGNIIFQCDEKPQTAIVELNFDEITSLRKRFNCLSDRRPAIYQKLSTPSP